MNSLSFYIMLYIAFVVFALGIYFVNKNLPSYLERKGGLYREEQFRRLYQDSINRDNITPITVQL